MIDVLKPLADGSPGELYQDGEHRSRIDFLHKLRDELERTWSNLTSAFARLNAKELFPDIRDRTDSNRPKIFVSYRRKDAAKLVMKVYRSLATGFSEEQIFVDVSNITSGQRFADVIREELDQCSILVSLIGKNWLNPAWGAELSPLFDGYLSLHENQPSVDDWVRLEVETALAMRKPVIPMLLGSTKLPQDSKLPESLKGILQHQAARLRPWCGYENDIDQLIGSLRKLAPQFARQDDPVW